MNDSVIMWPVAVYSIFFQFEYIFNPFKQHVFFSCFILNNNTQMSSGATADLNEQIQKKIFF